MKKRRLHKMVVDNVLDRISDFHVKLRWCIYTKANADVFDYVDGNVARFVRVTFSDGNDIGVQIGRKYD